MEKYVNFIKEVKEELKKIVWPTKDETIGTTTVVVIFVVLMAIFLGVVDVALSKIIQFIVG
ncbi:preprotein translocase subunit SecE [Calditerrivibrio nitroreducens]|uniref:Protein translocase subunit SecE n=1 Tax=Calditerrivibrio nitroreducens (strain DSM 19672 / NBRC 101217 / Yu37-1) TaxID=768670 RepID=E4TF02_CALNY|nr:preprotein translocase subunit SecE [Calditerrivibrio nitroreducens]ADR19442.1 preprotein translocase, SecE subunit [Calditerrivibrio nitroreducens DSM 19672]